MRPRSQSRLSRAPSGRPWDGPSREILLERAITKLLGFDVWSSSALNRIYIKLSNAKAPAAAKGAFMAAEAAFLAHDPQTRRLREKLLGAVSVPGWGADALRPVGALLVEHAQDVRGGEDFAAAVDALRAALGGSRS